MADHARFDRFADFLRQRFPNAARVFDVAGGQGKLNEALTRRGCTVTTFDVRWKHLPVRYEQRLLTLDEPCTCDLVVGLHPDGATRVVIDYAALHQLPFAVVPCCSDNSLPYKPWLRHVEDVAVQHGFMVERAELPITGRATVICGEMA